MKEFPMTVLGKKLIEDELEKLIKIEREKLKIEIATARAHGDLKENSEYHAAKEKQSHVEGRIAELQNKVAKSKLVELEKISNKSRIVFGATVTLFDIEKETSVTFQIVGEDEAMTSSKKLSYLSPMGAAVMGKEEGDEAIVKAPKGDISFEIENVEYI
jgi:transcription elongation factor GreA